MVRSMAAKVYCVRSLVPIEKKFTSRANSSAMIAAEGTSIMVADRCSLRLKGEALVFQVLFDLGQDHLALP